MGDVAGVNGAYEHLVFITYSVSGMSMLGIVLVLLQGIGLSGGC